MAAPQCFTLLFKLASVHYVHGDVSNTVTAWETLECSQLCFGVKSCVSFIYNIKTKECMLHGRWATDADAANHDVVMYNSNRNLCPVEEGYTLNLAIMVCYKLHADYQTHSSAESTCKSEGGDGLLRIDNVDKKDFFVEQEAVHVNGMLNDDEWVFANGDRMTYLPFQDNQPDDYGIGGEPCLEFYNGYNDIPCNEERKFLCEERL